jgi:hypothetical protein
VHVANLSSTDLIDELLMFRLLDRRIAVITP